jgi:hypothetical protein
MEPMATDRVREVEPPAEARALTTLARVDYQDGFFVDVSRAPGHSGEEWARATLEAAPQTMRRSLLRGWTALGLKLAPADAEGAVLGWEVRHGGEGFALLGRDSRIGMPAELLFRPEPDGLLFATFIEQGNPLARSIWAPIAAPHRRIVPALLERAEERLALVV